MSLDVLLRRYDPRVRRRFGTYRLSNGARVRGRRVSGDERLARGLAHHVDGVPGEDEALEDLVRVFVPGRLLPAELALALPVEVVIREDAGLGLFWFENEDPDLTVCAHPADELPLAFEGADEAYVCGIDAPRGASEGAKERAWKIAHGLVARVGGVVVDRYGFRVTGPGDLV